MMITMMIDDIIMMTMMMRIIIFVILVATRFKVFNQDGLRIQCVLMVNAKLDPEELPDNTVQVSNINNDKKNDNNHFNIMMLLVDL